MQERHDREQYFFDAPTREALADALVALITIPKTLGNPCDERWRGRALG